MLKKAPSSPLTIGRQQIFLFRVSKNHKYVSDDKTFISMGVDILIVSLSLTYLSYLAYLAQHNLASQRLLLHSIRKCMYVCMCVLAG